MSESAQVLVYAPETENLRYPPDCPFKTERATATRRQLLGAGLLGTGELREEPCRPASRAELERLHTPRYLDLLQAAAAGELTPEGIHAGLGAPDTPVFRDLWDYACWACGAALHAADLLLQGRARVAFNLHGGFHHAHADRAGGFCYLNDVALACERLAAAGRRVMYLDLDAHHGDGVQAFFYARNDVLTVSLHESGKTLFPWGGFEHELGEGPGHGYNVNVPLPAQTYDEAYLRAYRTVVPPLIEAYRPDVLVVELGMDILAGDPLTHLQTTNNVVVEIARHLRQTGLPLLVSGGGGYQFEPTVRGWALAWRTLAGRDDEDALSMGLGGALMSTLDWAGGWRDPERPVPAEVRERVESELAKTLATLREIVPLLRRH
ncbi:acetoin utilization protein AcuC [Limisphaera sp. 4302-co]|uniref:acetoin utilization protein AcuC n=1 Tax=Limisphaera sp. 4302-co TaxID=3400417 RepID=UPI003C190238